MDYKNFNQSQLQSLVDSKDLLSLKGRQRSEVRDLLSSSIEKSNLEASRTLNRDNAINQKKLDLFAQRVEAGAAVYKASLEAGQAATNSSRVLAEFEKQRSLDRVLGGRAMDRAAGQIKAGFSASSVGSIGAEQESYRIGNSERVNIESDLNRQKQEIINRGSRGISQAFATTVSQSASIVNAAEAVNTAKSIGVKKI